jgi:hypothetical protein
MNEQQPSDTDKALMGISCTLDCLDNGMFEGSQSQKVVIARAFMQALWEQYAPAPETQNEARTEAE